MCGGLNRGCTALPTGGRELRKATPIHAARPGRIPSRENKVGQGGGKPETHWPAHLALHFRASNPSTGKTQATVKGRMGWVGSEDSWPSSGEGDRGKGQLSQAYLERRGRGWLLSS